MNKRIIDYNVNITALIYSTYIYVALPCIVNYIHTINKNLIIHKIQMTQI